MNADQHEDFARIALHLSGYDEKTCLAFVRGCKEADHLDDVACSFPLHDEFPATLSALCHFQRPDGIGYYWDRDKSLGTLRELIGDAALHLAGSKVSGTSAPMRLACADQPGAVLSDFRFPSVALYGSHWSTFPHLSEENGRACHLVQDSCIPHHAWGVLLWGHQEFEDALEALWDQHRVMLKASSDPKASEREFCQLVRSIDCRAATVEELIKSNAAWSLEWFGQPHRQEECSISDCLAVCSRAVAATMRAMQIMGITRS